MVLMKRRNTRKKGTKVWQECKREKKGRKKGERERVKRKKD